MKLETTEDVLDLMNGHVIAAVLNTAMEVGLFWLLATTPLSASAIASYLNIPLNRCYFWLELLCRIGLLEQTGEGYVPTALARDTILNGPDQDTWAFQACEDRALLVYMHDLASNISKSISAWPLPNLPPAANSKQIESDPGYIARFTRKLYQIHRALADQLASMLDVHNAQRLLDLGGGSGVVSFALLRRYAQLTAVVVDIEPVCQVGRELAAEQGLERRVTYLAADIFNDALPTEFDIVLLCDVGAFNEALFLTISSTLKPEGCLVIVDKFAPTSASAPASRLLSAFIASLEAPADFIDYITAEMVQARLQAAGFCDITRTEVPHSDTLPWNMDWTMLRARKQTST